MFEYTLTSLISILEYSVQNKNEIHYNDYVQVKVKIIKRLTTHSFHNASEHTYIFQQDLYM